MTMQELQQQVKGHKAKIYNYKPSGKRFLEGIATIDKIVDLDPYPTRYLCHFDDEPTRFVERNIYKEDII